MDSSKISYAGVAGAVAGVVALLGVYSNWWESSQAVYSGTADASGNLALAMALATFAFGGAFILLSDPRIRRSVGALMTLCATVLVIACVWGLTRSDEVAPDAVVATGLYVSMLGGTVGVAAGILSLQDVMKTDAEIEAEEAAAASV
jgi:hypothetical protein